MICPRFQQGRESVLLWDIGVSEVFSFRLSLYLDNGSWRFGHVMPCHVISLHCVLLGELRLYVYEHMQSNTTGLNTAALLCEDNK